jgi:hypothetical protein
MRLDGDTDGVPIDILPISQEQAGYIQLDSGSGDCENCVDGSERCPESARLLNCITP